MKLVASNFTEDEKITNEKKRLHKILFSYLIVTILCAIVGLNFWFFNKNNTSIHLTILFLYPLVFGLLFVFYKNPKNLFLNCYSISVGVVIITSLIRGIFEITNIFFNYENLYLIMAMILMIIALIYNILNKTPFY